MFGYNGKLKEEKSILKNKIKYLISKIVPSRIGKLYEMSCNQVYSTVT